MAEATMEPRVPWQFPFFRQSLHKPCTICTKRSAGMPEHRLIERRDPEDAPAILVSGVMMPISVSRYATPAVSAVELQHWLTSLRWHDTQNMRASVSARSGVSSLASTDAWLICLLCPPAKYPIRKPAIESARSSTQFRCQWGQRSGLRSVYGAF